MFLHQIGRFPCDGLEPMARWAWPPGPEPPRVWCSVSPWRMVCVPWFLGSSRHTRKFLEKKTVEGWRLELCHIPCHMFDLGFRIPFLWDASHLNSFCYQTQFICSCLPQLVQHFQNLRKPFWVPKPAVTWVPMWVWHGSSGAPICRRCPSCPAFWRTSNRLLAEKRQKVD